MTMPNQIPCACGCGGTRPALRRDGQPARYIAGHSNKHAPGAPISVRYTHQLAQQKLAHVKQCQLLHLGHCKGPLDTAHIDGNHFNNEDSNLRKLCRSHHMLHDFKVITMDTQTMPAYRERGDGATRAGERRFNHARRAERQRRKQRRTTLHLSQTAIAAGVQPSTY